MNKITVFIFCIIISINTIAQQRSNSIHQVLVSGKIVDTETKQNLEYATIICTPSNGKKITGGITNEKGEFEIEVTKGTYNISIEFISFKTKTIKNIVINSNTNLGNIFLQINAEALNEIEIIAEKSTVEIRLDKKIYNVGKDMTVKGGSASDVLDNVPSVSVDVEGNVSLRGNENVRILVNGKPSGLVGLSSTDALRQLPADAIEKVEVITSPSARYDAEGTAGILNIILRKGKALGFNGSITTTAGNPDYFGGSTNLNFRSKKLNFFTSTGYYYRNAPGSSSNSVLNLNPSAFTPANRNEVIDYERKKNSFNTRFGVEYYISNKSSIIGTVLYNTSNGTDLSTNLIDELDANEILEYTSKRIESEKEKDKTIEYSLNFTQDFKKEGHKLMVDFQYGETTENGNAIITDSELFPIFIENSLERNSTDEKSKDILFKGDYVYPINEDSQFEFGFKTDLNKLIVDYLVEDYDEGQYINNTNFSNILNFEQNIYSLYTQYGHKINKFSYLFGLRMEATDRKIHFSETDENFNKKFSEFFPTINLGLEFSDAESITLGYSKRIRRPHHYFLHPFESQISETYIRKGNVNLDPTYTNSLDLSYLKKWNKFTLNSSVYYQHSINNIEMVQTEEYRDSNGNTILFDANNPDTDPELNSDLTLVIIRSPINLSTQDRYGFEFTANYTPFKWWKISNSFNYYKYETVGEFNETSYNTNNTSWFTRFNSRVTLPGKIDWQTRAMYRGPSKTALSEREAMVSVNLAFSKDIFKEKGTISLNVSDLLNSRKHESTTYTENTISQSEFRYRERQILLNFTYRFNQKKKRERSSGSYNEGGEMF